MTVISNSTSPTAQTTQPHLTSNSFQIAQASNTDKDSIFPVLNNVTAAEAASFYGSFATAEAPVAVATVLLPNEQNAVYARWVDDFGPNNLKTHADIMQNIRTSIYQAIENGILPAGSTPSTFFVSPKSTENNDQLGDPVINSINDEIGHSYPF
jgi:hypothetical protein